MKTLLVIHEKDKEDHSVIGIAETPEIAIEMLKKYYGGYRELQHYYMEENIVWQKELEVKSYDNSLYKVWVWIEWYAINEI